MDWGFYLMKQHTLYQEALHHLRVVIPAIILGVFFSLPHVCIWQVVGTVVLAYITAFVIQCKLTMPTAWLHALSVNAVVSMILALIVLIQALIKPFPDVSDWGNVILLACGIMFLFLVVFGIATVIYWQLEKRIYHQLIKSSDHVVDK